MCDSVVKTTRNPAGRTSDKNDGKNSYEGAKFAWADNQPAKTIYVDSWNHYTRHDDTTKPAVYIPQPFLYADWKIYEAVTTGLSVQRAPAHCAWNCTNQEGQQLYWTVQN